MHRDVAREEQKMPSLSAALISKAAFIMRKLNQNRKQTKPQIKQKKKKKKLQLAHLPNHQLEYPL